MNTIKSATITLHPFGYSEVIARLDNGDDEKLFTFYSDELSFQPFEFEGLTIEQAKALRHKRDVEYLQS
jgi:hypothetical protein